MLGIYLEAEFLEQELLVILIDVPEVFLPGGCALVIPPAVGGRGIGFVLTPRARSQIQFHVGI